MREEWGVKYGGEHQENTRKVNFRIFQHYFWIFFIFLFDKYFRAKRLQNGHFKR